jgi:hypothetical protein
MPKKKTVKNLSKNSDKKERKKVRKKYSKKTKKGVGFYNPLKKSKSRLKVRTLFIYYNHSQEDPKPLYAYYSKPVRDSQPLKYFIFYLNNVVEKEGSFLIDCEEIQKEEFDINVKSLDRPPFYRQFFSSGIKKYPTTQLGKNDFSLEFFGIDQNKTNKLKDFFGQLKIVSNKTKKNNMSRSIKNISRRSITNMSRRSITNMSRRSITNMSRRNMSQF